MYRKLIITRRKHINGAIAAYYVQINGATLEKISNGQTVTMEIPTSAVTLKIVAPPALGSKEVTIPAGSREVHAEVYQKMGMWSSSLEIALS